MSVDAKIMTVVSAIKQSLQMSGSPGSSVNTHPNPFYINVTGEVNLKHAAELIIQRLEEYEVALKARIEKSIKRTLDDANALADANAQAVNNSVKVVENAVEKIV